MISSPLRYPGGKAKLFRFFADLISENELLGCRYVEPYAGGAGLAIKLLTEGFVDSVSLNDIDPAIFAFWKSVLYDTDAFCEKLASTSIDISQWYLQRDIWRAGGNGSELDFGFSTYFLNRTNRSGIIEGAGPIGGYKQEGNWPLDARLVKSKQIENIRFLSRFSQQIVMSCEDALDFTRRNIFEKNVIVYLDPPYYIKGQKLYKNFYKPEDHVEIASELASWRQGRWVVSYDDVPPIRNLYGDFSPLAYSLNYSAGKVGLGTEVVYLSDGLRRPKALRFPNAA